MRPSSLSGKTSQRRSIRAPMGDTVLSITSTSDVPPSCSGAFSSRLRTVKLSSLTYRSPSMRLRLVMCAMCVCCVSSRYCSMAPAATSPSLSLSTPKPFMVRTLKWWCSFCVAVCSVKTQSSSSKRQSLVPSICSTCAFRPRSMSISFGWKLAIILSMYSWLPWSTRYSPVEMSSSEMPKHPLPKCSAQRKLFSL